MYLPSWTVLPMCVCVCVCVYVWVCERERGRDCKLWPIHFSTSYSNSSPFFRFLPVSPLPFQALSTSQSQSQSHLFSLLKKKIIPLLSTSSIAVIYFFVTTTPKLSDLIPIFLWVRGAVPLIVLPGLTQVTFSDRQSEGPRWPHTGLVSWCDCQVWQLG